ncbi:MAG: preprotein translocase subunit SecE [Acidobacteria bacterium CG_4_9_14_3_um_filter_49_7]|nr:MAG: preprotein translocase subunit SecE [Acidobacteria bacterium CG_4_9_14_3_um_filter_49_7]
MVGGSSPSWPATFFGDEMGKFTTFVKDSWGELRRVTWPTKDDVISTTIAVLVLTVIFSFFIYLSDKVLSVAVEWVYRIAGS